MSEETFSVTLRANEKVTIEIKHSPTKKRSFKGWLGCDDKTLYDWLTLLSSILLPFAIAIFTIALTIRENHEQREERERDLEIAALRRAQDRNMAEQQRNETILSSYLKDVSDLILRYGYQLNDRRARVTASSMTLTALQQLSTDKKQFIIRYLYRMTFINHLETDQPFSLSGADLSDIQLTDQLSPKHRSKRKFHGLYLPSLYLSNATFDSLKIQYSYFDHSDLAGVNFSSSSIQYGSLRAAQLQDSDFHDANISDTDLRNANFTGANIQDEQLRKAAFLDHVIFPNGSSFSDHQHDSNVLSMKNWMYNGTWERNFFNRSMLIEQKNKISISQEILLENYAKRYWIDQERISYTFSTVMSGENLTAQVMFLTSNGTILRIDRLDQITRDRKYHQSTGSCRRHAYLLRVEVIIQPTNETFFIEYVHLNISSQFNMHH